MGFTSWSAQVGEPGPVRTMGFSPKPGAYYLLPLFLWLVPPLSGCYGSDGDQAYYPCTKHEGLREKTGLLGGFQENLLKFHILKIKFLHEKIIFLDLDFFPDKVWFRNIQK